MPHPTNELMTAHPGTARLLADVAAAEDVVDPHAAPPLTKRPVAPYTPPGLLAGTTNGRTDAPLISSDPSDQMVDIVHGYGKKKIAQGRLDALLDAAGELNRLGMIVASDVVLGLYHSEKAGGAA